MSVALQEAGRAAERGEVPVGAVLVLDGKAVASAGNRTLGDCDPSAHAEVVTLRVAAAELGNHRVGGTLYVTLEPCVMCMGGVGSGACGAPWFTALSTPRPVRRSLCIG